MKTIELAYIFPFTLMIMVSLILLSFSLHDMILYKASTYKYLVCNNINSTEPESSFSDELAPLKNYINNFSLTNNSVKLEKKNYKISIESSEYNSAVNCTFYDKCDLLRKCCAAKELINTINKK